MKMKIALSVSTCVLGILAIYSYARCRSLQEDALKARQQCSETYIMHIGQFARGLAKLHVRHDRAMYLVQGGPEEINPKPVYGYPVCQLGCMPLLVYSVSDGHIDHDVESPFVRAYNQYLEAHPSSEE